MIRTTRWIKECKCRNCGIIHLLGETFNGQRCCEHPHPDFIGEREVPQYEKTNEEEKDEVLEQMNNYDWQ